MTHLAKPIEFTPRHHRLGLGAVSKEAPNSTPQLTKNVKVIDEKAEQLEDLAINKEVMIIQGNHRNLEAVIVDINEES